MDREAERVLRAELERLRARVAALEAQVSEADSAPLLRLIADSLPAYIAYVDAEGRFRFHNATYEQRFGRAPGAIEGRTMAEVFGAETYETIRLQTEAALAGQRVDFTWEGLDGDGQPRCFDASYVPRLGADGEVLGFFLLAHDVTRHKQDREALAEREEHLRVILSSLHETPVLLFDRDGTITGVWGAEHLPEIAAPRRVLDRTLHELLAPREAAAALAALRHTFDTGETQRMRRPVDLARGRHWFDICLSPIRAADGAVRAVLAVCRDVTTEHAAARQQRLELEASAALARVGRELIATTDPSELLGRLGHLVLDVLDCDASHTFLLEDDRLVVVDGVGLSAEEEEQLRAIDLPRAPFQPLIERLAREGVVDNAIDDEDPLSTTALARRFGIQRIVNLPLRKGRTVVGVHTASYRRPEPPLDARRLGVARGIAHLASLALETARLVQELDTANQFKADFLANMSHELRTPLHVVYGYNEMLLEGAFGALSDEQADILGRVQRNTRDLLNLVETTLELSRPTAQTLPLSVDAIDVGAFLDELGHETEALPRPEDLALEWSASSNGVPLYTDRLKLKMILKNLVENAVKFTTRGRIVVTATPVPDGVEFRVSDTGHGMPADRLEDIFEPFHRLATDAGTAGAGLGLYIVRRLLDALGGSVHVDSAPGRGSTFTVWVPNLTA